jgi:hypothetical protein
MTDIPNSMSPSDAQRMRDFFSLYGSFLQLWQTFEILIEISIMRQLSLSARHASLLLNSLNFAAKSNILLALLKEDAEKNKAAISAISTAQNQAGRNDFIHSFLTVSNLGSMRLVRRGIKNGNYSATLRSVDVETMHDHAHQFSLALERSYEALAITPDEVSQYAKEIESHA